MSQFFKVAKPGWSSLPPEILEEISVRVRNFSDHVRFRSVCSSWRSAARPRRLPPRAPFLIMAPYELSNGSGDLFCVSSQKLHHVDIPSAVSKQCNGSSRGWLFLRHNTSSLSLLNPFTRAEIQLPTLHNIAFISKAVLSSDPSLDPESMALLVLQYNTLAFCRVGGDQWTITHDLEWSLQRIEDIMFYKGNIYVVRQNGRLAYCDLSHSTTLSVIPYIRILQGQKFYFVESCGGLYLVTRHMLFDGFPFRARTVGFGVFRIELGDRWKLFPVDDMKDCVLFVGPNQSICLATKDLNGFDGNCIYFVEDYAVDGYVCDIEPKICKYRLDEDNIEELQHDVNRFFFGSPESQWIIPSVTV